MEGKFTLRDRWNVARMLPRLDLDANRLLRRNYVNGLFLLITGLSQLSAIPAYAQGQNPDVPPIAGQAGADPGPELGGAPEIDVIQTAWEGVPVVGNEKKLNGNLDLSDVYVVKDGVNQRTEPSSQQGNATVIQTLDPGAIFESDPTEMGMNDLDPSSERKWNKALVVHDGKTSLDKGVEGYIADGFFEPATEVPPELEARYQTPAELSQPTLSLDIAVAQTSLDAIGGTDEQNDALAALWGVENVSQLTALQRYASTAVTQFDFLNQTENLDSRDIDLGEAFPQIGEAKIHVRALPSGHREAILQILHPEETAVPRRMFFIVRIPPIGLTEQPAQAAVATQEAFVAGLGAEKAEEIAQSTVLVSGDGVLEEVAKTANAVYLAGNPEGQQFAQPITPKPGETVQYERSGNNYFAITRDNQGNESKNVYLSFENSVEAVSLPSAELQSSEVEQVVRAFKLDMGTVGEVGFDSMTLNGNNEAFAYLSISGDNGRDNLAGKVPLLKAEKTSSGEWKWEKIALRDLADRIEFKIGTLVEQNTVNYLDEMNFGFCYQRWGYSDNVRDTKYRTSRLAGPKGIREFISGHIITPTELPEGAGSWSKVELEAEIRARVREAMSVPGIKYYTLVNEPGTVGGRVDGLERTLGIEEYTRIASEEAQIVDPDAILLLNDTIAQQDLAKRMFNQGLIHATGVQKHIMQYGNQAVPTKASLLQEFQSYGMPLMVTELDINQTWLPSGTSGDPNIEQAKIAKNLVEAALESGVVIGINMWGIKDTDSWLVAENWDGRYAQTGGSAQANPLPFDSEGQKKAFYYAMTTAMYEHMLQRQGQANLQ